jgi:DNA-binding NarL/FixJ family response regulator
MGADLMSTLAIIDDHPVYRHGIAASVSADGRWEVIGAFDGVEAYLAQSVTADVVLLDFHLPGLHGPAAVERLSEAGTAVLMLSGDVGRDAVLATLAVGARGYIAKHAEVAEILEAVSIIVASPTGSYVSPQLAAFLLDAVQEKGPRPLRLTERELEVLALVAAGERDRDVAETLCLSIGTVRSHLDHIRTKTGQHRRVELTRYAIDQGLVPDRKP